MERNPESLLTGKTQLVLKAAFKHGKVRVLGSHSHPNSRSCPKDLGEPKEYSIPITEKPSGASVA